MLPIPSLYKWLLYGAFAIALVFAYKAWEGHQREIGYEQGRVKGHAEGRVEGHAEGRAEVQAEWAADKIEKLQQLAAFNAENRRIEQRRQSLIAEALDAAKKRETANAADAERLRALNDGLRDDLAVSRAHLSSASTRSLRGRVTALETVFEQCSRANESLAGDAAGLASDLRLMLDSWPK